MGEFKKHYEVMVADGVKSILWKTNTHDPSTGRVIPAVRRAKDFIGAENMDVPVIDTRHVVGTQEWCNIILYTTNVNAWESALSEYYIQTPSPGKKSNTKQLYYAIEAQEEAFTVQCFCKKADDSTNRT